MRNLIGGWLAAASLVTAFAGCNSLSHACTLVGCTDQLTVNIRRSVPSRYQVNLTIDGQSAQFTCDNGTPRGAVGVTVALCGPNSFVIVGAPSTVHVILPCGVGPDDAGVNDCGGDLKPTYIVAQPNGPDCEPTCKQATVDL